ncbi:MAG: DoxX family protein [Kribbellaceae bacterium]|nr:DoxX family protein [Kribbellaceae bacterium]
MFDVTVWVAEGFVALFFLAAGVPKIAGRGLERWVGFDQVPRLMTIGIGVSEVAAAVGLVVPLLVGTAEWTTPLAGLGIAVISLMASGFHIRNREWLSALESALWAALGGTIAAARWSHFRGGPSIPRDWLVGLLMVLVPVVIVNLVVLANTTGRPELVTERG